MRKRLRTQDIVPKQGKLISIYARPGHRVLINARGDLIVRPSFLEINILKPPFCECFNLLHV